MSDLIKVGILNATGYAGAELVRIVSRHPNLVLEGATARSHVGRQIGSVFPHLTDVDLELAAELPNGLDAVFAALPHGTGAKSVAALVEQGIVCVDLSADFRLRSKLVYERAYGCAHPAPQLLSQAVYGLPEWNRERIAGAKLVASPGCFPTGMLLGMLPALRSGLLADGIINISTSGVSGAGRNPDIAYRFAEMYDNCAAYGLEGHRHEPEMVQEAGVEVRFTPLLAPFSRGIIGINYALLKHKKERAEIVEIYRQTYAEEPFVEVANTAPSVKQVRGSNRVVISPFVRDDGWLVVVTVLDNLVKGAAGQAVQNMNLVMGLEERAGLNDLALYP